MGGGPDGGTPNDRQNGALKELSAHAPPAAVMSWPPATVNTGGAECSAGIQCHCCLRAEAPNGRRAAALPWQAALRGHSKLLYCSEWRGCMQLRPLDGLLAPAPAEWQDGALSVLGALWEPRSGDRWGPRGGAQKDQQFIPYPRDRG